MSYKARFMAAGPSAPPRYSQRSSNPMCSTEVYVVLYVCCNHVVRQHYSGEIFDCGSATCGGSRAHACKTSCICQTSVGDKMKIVDQVHERCLSCKATTTAQKTKEAGNYTLRNLQGALQA